MNYATVFCSRLNCWSRARFILVYSIDGNSDPKSPINRIGNSSLPGLRRRDKRGWARWACSAQPFWKTAKVDIELLDYCTCLRFLQRVILQNLENLLANRQNLNSFFSGENIECRVYHDALVKNEFLTVSTRSFSMSEPRASIARMESGTFGDDQVTKLSTKIKPVTLVK